MPHVCTKLEEPFPLVNFQMDRTPSFLISSEYKKKESRCVCLSEDKASQSHKLWIEVSSSVPHFLQVGLLHRPIIYKYPSKQVNNNRGL